MGGRECGKRVHASRTQGARTPQGGVHTPDVPVDRVVPWGAVQSAWSLGCWHGPPNPSYRPKQPQHRGGASPSSAAKFIPQTALRCRKEGWSARTRRGAGNMAFPCPTAAFPFWHYRAIRGCQTVLRLSRLLHWLPGREAHPEGKQGTTEFHDGGCLCRPPNTRGYSRDHRSDLNQKLSEPAATRFCSVSTLDKMNPFI